VGGELFLVAKIARIYCRNSDFIAEYSDGIFTLLLGARKCVNSHTGFVINIEMLQERNV
jgi:hypothetical protein